MSDIACGFPRHRTFPARQDVAALRCHRVRQQIQIILICRRSWIGGGEMVCGGLFRNQGKLVLPDPQFAQARRQSESSDEFRHPVVEFDLGRDYHGRAQIGESVVGITKVEAQNVWQHDTNQCAVMEM